MNRIDVIKSLVRYNHGEEHAELVQLLKDFDYSVPKSTLEDVSDSDKVEKTIDKLSMFGEGEVHGVDMVYMSTSNYYPPEDINDIIEIVLDDHDVELGTPEANEYRKMVNFHLSNPNPDFHYDPDVISTLRGYTIGVIQRSEDEPKWDILSEAVETYYTD